MKNDLILGIKNFRCFGDSFTEINLGNINLLYGGNSSGKTSVLKAAYLLSACWGRTYFQMPTGPKEFYDLGSFDEQVNNKSNPIVFKLKRGLMGVHVFITSKSNYELNIKEEEQLFSETDGSDNHLNNCVLYKYEIYYKEEKAPCYTLDSDYELLGYTEKSSYWEHIGINTECSFEDFKGNIKRCLKDPKQFVYGTWHYEPEDWGGDDPMEDLGLSRRSYTDALLRCRSFKSFILKCLKTKN